MKIALNFAGNENLIHLPERKQAVVMVIIMIKMLLNSYYLIIMKMRKNIVS